MTRSLDLLKAEHIQAVSEMAARCFSQSWSPSDYSYFINHACGYCYGLFEEEKLKGYLLSLLVHGDLDIISIGVDLDARRKGIGETLLGFAQQDPRVSRIVLEVDIENTPAIQLYTKLQFVVRTIRKKYYEHSRDAYLMEWRR